MITASGVLAVKAAAAAIVTAAVAVAAVSTTRKPKRFIRGVVAGLMPMLPTKMNSTMAPDLTGLQPKTFWNSSGSRNGAAPTMIQNSDPPPIVARSVLRRSTRRSTRGCSVRSRCLTVAARRASDAMPRTAAGIVAAPGSASRCAVSVSPASPAEVMITPITSSRGGFAGGVDGMSLNATARATMPSGMLMRNSQRQLAWVTMSPPASGAMTGATSPGHTMKAISRMMSCLSAFMSTVNRPTGTIIAPPTPCRTRSATSSPRLVLVAHSNDATVKITMAARNTFLAPSRAASHPLSGISTASVIRYAVITSPTWAEATCRSAPIRGAAVVTMVPSRFSMKKQLATSKAMLRCRGVIMLLT
jgi:hypothetical protein